MKKATLSSLTLLLSGVLISVGCRQPETAEPAVVRVENPVLGLVIAALPEPFEIVSATGETIDLRAPGPGGEGRAVLAVGEPRPHGVNLIDEVKARRAAFEALPGGTYLGNRELGTPTGTAFTARGTYDADPGKLEETWVYALHPSERNRLMTLTYTYPEGESERRVNELLLLLGEIEGLAGTPSEGS